MKFKYNNRFGKFAMSDKYIYIITLSKGNILMINN